MKRVIYLFISVIITSFVACNNQLDPETNLSLSEKDVSTYNNTMARLSGIYSFLPSGFSYIDGAMMASATDEAEHTLETSAIQKFNTGAWNAVSNPDGSSWTRNFDGIYAANLFLATSDSINLDYIKYDPSKQDVYLTYLANIKRWKYEARFLRAFYYFELIKRFGGVPILTKPMGLNADFKNIKRDSLCKCVNFIAAECDSAAQNLPARYSNDGDLGRATQIAALALKSRVLLYAASELYNNTSWTNGYGHPEFISMTDNKTRLQRWEEAAQAAYDAINSASSAGYGLLPMSNYKSLFMPYNGISPVSNSELIFGRREGQSNYFEYANFPIGYNGNSGTTPTGNLVDSYEMTDGSDFSWTNPAEAADPYSNRDPRLAFSVLTNNVQFKGSNLEIWTGGISGKGVLRATKTGYYLNKYVDTDLDLLQGYSSVHCWILFRYAEILLNYAEAAFYAYGKDGAVPGVNLTAIQAYNMVRSRVNMPNATASTSDKDFEQKIRRERRIELAFEDHRFWDVRRWMIAPETLNVPVTGVEITRNGNNNFSYKPIQVETRVFEPKMYFYPIPQKEINITGWNQNPLW